ncbi:Heavy metal sensor signal transduction histidine kinase (fragment) [Candidatus Sulfopaludibacter sp. SbA3]
MNGMLARIESSFHQMREFVANASHELRTPIAIIRATAEVALLEGELSPRSSSEALHRILREAERDSALLEDMLRIARIDSAGPIDQSRWQPVDLGASLALACSDIRPLAESRRLTVRLSPSRNPCLIEGDEEQLHRLWLILLDNACKYTLPGGAITAGVIAKADGQFAAFVKDNGIGIAPEHRDRIFERFYRVDKARSRSLGGSGLGLAIAHHIVKAHDAAFQLESEPGKGSRFSIAFPRAACSTTPAIPAASTTIFR